MRELSVNYPKQEEDEAKIQKYTDKYARELENIVNDEMANYIYKDLNVNADEAYNAPFAMQLKNLLWRSRIFVVREP